MEPELKLEVDGGGTGWGGVMTESVGEVCSQNNQCAYGLCEMLGGNDGEKCHPDHARVRARASKRRVFLLPIHLLQSVPCHFSHRLDQNRVRA